MYLMKVRINTEKLIINVWINAVKRRKGKKKSQIEMSRNCENTHA